MFWLSTNSFYLIIGILLCACPAAGAAPKSADEQLFRFQNGFWINLHHFLYQQALIQAGRLNAGPDLIFSHLPEDAKGRWSRALAFYSNQLIDHDFLTDTALIGIDSNLRLLNNDPVLQEQIVQVIPGLFEVLSDTASVYRAYYWPAQRKQNADWIATSKKLADTYGPSLRQQLQKDFGTELPSEPVRVDVVHYANWAGAYTNEAHSIISSSDPSNRGISSLEVLFHEASHTIVFPRHGVIGGGIEEAARYDRVAVPEGFWHALIFFTVGMRVKEILAQHGVGDYTPYADRNGLWKGAWDGFRPALEACWSPYLTGSSPRQEALDCAVSRATVH